MAERPLRILALVPSLGGGGAEKHVERLANGVDRAEATIDVAVVRRGGSYEKFLGEDVRVIALALAKPSSGTAQLALSIPRLWSLARSGTWDAIFVILERPALAALAVHAMLPRRIRPALVLSVQADPENVIAGDPLGAVFEVAMRHLYRRADGIVAISRGVADALRRLDPALDPVVIPNVCVDDHTDRSLASALTRTKHHAPTIVAAGRLTRQKGFDVLLDAFAQVKRAIPDSRLRILGTGPLEQALRDQAARLGISSSVDFVGFVAEPMQEFVRAHVFCLSSRFEGLGMVVAEAMAAGTPVVVTDCPHGPSDIVEGGTSGVLVPVEDPVALAAALIRVLEDPEERARFSRLGLARAEAFRAGAIAHEHVKFMRRLRRG